MRETFTSRVTLDIAEPEDPGRYLDGPFSHLDNAGSSSRLGNRWRGRVFHRL